MHFGTSNCVCIYDSSWLQPAQRLAILGPPRGPGDSKTPKGHGYILRASPFLGTEQIWSVGYMQHFGPARTERKQPSSETSLPSRNHRNGKKGGRKNNQSVRYADCTAPLNPPQDDADAVTETLYSPAERRSIFLFDSTPKSAASRVTQKKSMHHYHKYVIPSKSRTLESAPPSAPPPIRLRVGST